MVVHLYQAAVNIKHTRRSAPSPCSTGCVHALAGLWPAVRRLAAAATGGCRLQRRLPAAAACGGIPIVRTTREHSSSVTFSLLEYRYRYHNGILSNVSSHDARVTSYTNNLIGISLSRSTKYT